MVNLNQKNHAINEFKQDLRDLERFAYDELVRRLLRAIASGRRVKQLTASADMGKAVERLEDQLRYEKETWPSFIKDLFQIADDTRAAARAADVAAPDELMHEATLRGGRP